MRQQPQASGRKGESQTLPAKALRIDQGAAGVAQLRRGGRVKRV